MGRFERDSDTTNLPETLGVATEGLRSTIEVEVARIVETAEQRATEIEDRALEKASRVEQSSERRLEAALEDSRLRLTQMFAQIDAVELSLNDTVRHLRAEALGIRRGLEAAGDEPFEVEEPAPPAPAETEGPVEAPAVEAPVVEAPVVEAPVVEAPAVEAPAGAAPEEPEAKLPGTDPADPEVRELIRQQLQTLAEGGRTRADAERMLLRFRQGEQYFDLLDEIYPDSTPERRGGLLRRRKDRE